LLLCNTLEISSDHNILKQKTDEGLKICNTAVIFFQEYCFWHELDAYEISELLMKSSWAITRVSWLKITNVSGTVSVPIIQIRPSGM
jgi:hypothetical protein